MDSESTGSDYHEWNLRLVDHFFRSSRAGRSVRLSVDETVLRQLGGEKDDLVLAALEEVERLECHTIQDLGLVLCSGWKSMLKENPGGVDVPPFVGVLALYVLAVNHGEDQFTAHAYYDRLHDLLAEPQTRISAIKPSWCLWRELEHWSNRLPLGRFRVSAVGAQEWVGVPRRQTLLAERELKPLQRAFLAAALVPNSDPSDRWLHSAASKADGLLARTQRLLSKWPIDEAARELLVEIRSRFDDWDPAESEAEEAECLLRLPLRLLLHTEGGQITEATLVTDLVPGVTDDESLTELEQGAEGLRDAIFELHSQDDETVQIQLAVDHERDLVDQVSWFERLALRVENGRGLIHRAPSRHLFFARGRRPDTLREIDAREIRPGDDYILVMPAQGIEQTPSEVGTFLADWRVCDASSDVRFRPFRGAVRGSQEEWRPDIRLSGGIPSGRGREAFVSFALPDIVVESSSFFPSFCVSLQILDVNGIPALRQVRNSRHRASEHDPGQLFDSTDTTSLTVRMELEALSVSGCCHIEVLTENDEVIASRTFYCDAEPLSGETATPPLRDGFGFVTDDAEQGVIRGFDVVREVDSSVASMAIASRPLAPSKPPEIDVAAQRVMQLLRTRHRISWSDAKRVLPGCLPQNSPDQPRSRYLAHQVGMLHALGILEMVEGPHGGISELVELPPRLILLARRANDFSSGREPATPHQAVVAGCWMPDQLSALPKVAKKIGGIYHLGSAPAGAAFAPQLRSILAYGPATERRLRKVAKKLEVGLDLSVPYSCRLKSVLSDISDLAQHEGWRPGRPSDAFERRFFDPRSLAVSMAPPETDDRYLLWECRHPDRPVWSFFIEDRHAQQRLQVPDRQVARWFVRAQALPATPLPGEQSDLLVPFELRLPPLLERTLALSTGRAPEYKRYGEASSPFQLRRTAERFRIPPPPKGLRRWSFQDGCSGNFCLYRGVYGSAAWPKGTPLPMLGMKVERINEFGLEQVEL